MSYIRNSLGILSWLILLLMICGTTVYAADGEAGEMLSEEKKQEALVHFQKGQARFSQGEYLLAIEHFRISYDITGSPEILYNIAMCYEEQGENEQAISHYEMYLQVSAGDDTAEVKAKIKSLGGGDDGPKDADAEDDDDDDDDDDSGLTGQRKDKKKEGRLDRVSLELAMGPAFVILTPDTGVTDAGADPVKRNYFSVDILLHFYLNSWFAITGALMLGSYIEGESPYIARDPTNHVGAGLGVAMKKQFNPRTSLVTNILALPCSIKRENMTKRATWIAFDIRVGLNIMVTSRIEVNLTAVAEGGPAFVVNPTGTGDWDTGILLSVGPRLGLTVTF